MSCSNCCFLTFIQISQKAGQVVWYSHLLRNFPQFVVIHTVKGFGVVNKAEVDVFLELSSFFDYPTDVGNLTSGNFAFSKSSLNTWKFMVHIHWSLAWRILSITLLACEMSATVVVWTFFGIAFLWDWNENWPYLFLLISDSYWTYANNYITIKKKDIVKISNSIFWEIRKKEVTFKKHFISNCRSIFFKLSHSEKWRKRRKGFLENPVKYRTLTTVSIIFQPKQPNSASLFINPSSFFSTGP